MLSTMDPEFAHFGLDITAQCQNLQRLHITECDLSAFLLGKMVANVAESLIELDLSCVTFVDLPHDVFSKSFEGHALDLQPLNNG